MHAQTDTHTHTHTHTHIHLTDKYTNICRQISHIDILPSQTKMRAH